ncbi:hypothetical protein [Faecalibacillus faecis]|uniref:hypothetical protein n=1 Tax=Faecalibacillus faecis TaxID=1982628 RepID=UPI003054F2FF
MDDFKDFEIDMYDESNGNDGGVTDYSSSMACVGMSAVLSWTLVSVSTNDSSSMPCATLTNVSE